MKLVCLLSAFLISTSALAQVVPEHDILAYAAKHKFFDPHLALAIAQVESDQDSEAKNEDHYGLMQIKAGTARMLGFRGKLTRLYDWRTNLDLALQYLTEKHRQYRNLPYTIAAYNAGDAWVCRTGDSNGTPCRIGKFVNQRYVDLVLAHYRRLRKAI